MTTTEQQHPEDVLYEKFKADFPKEAYTALPGAAGLTALKAQYIVERLNDVAGVGGWEQVPSKEELVDSEGNPTHILITSDYVLVCYSLVIAMGEYKLQHSAFGSCKFGAHKREISDVFKSAKTDALSKAASHFGIGNDMFKGLIKSPKSGGYTKATPKAAPKTSNGPKW